MPRNGVEKRERGKIIFNFVLFMLKQIQGIFREESCFKAMASFQLESLINFLFHEPRLLNLFEDPEKRFLLSPTLFKSPGLLLSWLKSSQM